MTDDLLQRLERVGEYDPLGHDAWEAAARIRELEAQLSSTRDAALEEAAMKLDAMARTKTYTDEDLGETTGRNLIDPRKAAAALRAMKGGAK